MKSVLAVAIAASSPASAAILGHKAFLGNGMQPEVVARTLSNVEDEWKAQAAVFAACNSTTGLEGATIVNCQDAPTSFDKSCSTVVGAIVQGSGGDKDVAKEYMADVCGQHIMSGWHQEQCNQLAVAVRGAMTSDKYQNRMNFNTNKLCTSFWSHFLADEQHRLEQEKAEREAADKQAAAEEAEKERAHQDAIKKEAERKKAEEVARAKEEAEAKAAEAKAQAAEAAAKAAQKKAEAEEVALAAKQKMAEAQAAEQAHKKEVSSTKTAEAKAPAAPVKTAAVEKPKEVSVKPAKATAVEAPSKVEPAKAPATKETAALKAIATKTEAQPAAVKVPAKKA